MSKLPLHNLFIPSKKESNKLIIILHGRGDSSEGFRFFPQELGLNDVNYLLLDAPFEYYTGFSWYPLPPDQLPGIEYSSKILTKVFDKLFASEFSAAESFLFGFSQGSLLTFEFGARYHQVLAGYIAVSGYIYDTNKLLAEMNKEVKNAAWLCTHGVNDDVLAFETSKKQVHTLQENNFAVEFKSYNKGHTLDRDELIMISKWIKEWL